MDVHARAMREQVIPTLRDMERRLNNLERQIRELNPGLAPIKVVD